MLEAAIASVPYDKWNQGIGKWFFSFNVYHVIDTAQFYMLSDPDDMNWGGRAGIDWEKVEDMQKEVLPKLTKDFVHSYLKETKEKMASLFNTMTDQDYLEKDGFHWFDSILEKFVYLLRHSMLHIGELSRSLREWDCKHVKWR
jgi:hypothetical protein